MSKQAKKISKIAESVVFSESFLRQVAEITRVAQKMSAIHVPIIKAEIPRMIEISNVVAEAARESTIAATRLIASLERSGN